MTADAKDQTPLDLISRLLAALPLPAFVVDEQHRVHYMNRVARQRAPELQDRGEDDSPCYARIFRRDSPCELCVMSEALGDGADEVLCSQVIGGQQVRATGMRFVGEDGAAYVAEVVHMGGEGLVSSRSSTDQREDAMHSVIDSSNEVVLLFDGEYRTAIANRVAQQTLGYTAAEFAERTLVDLGVAKSTEELGKLLTRADSGVPATARAVIQSAQGGKMPVKVSLSLLVGSSTRVVGACTFAAPRYSSTAMPAMQRSASGPLPKTGMGPASGPLPRASMGPPSGPVPKPGLPSAAPPSKPKPPAKPKPAGEPAAAKEPGSGGVRKISESLEALAGNLESDSTVLKKAEKEKRKQKPKAPPPTPDKLAAEVEELDSELLELENGGPPAPLAPPAKPAPAPPAKPAPAPPAKPAPKPTAKPAPKPAAKPAPKPAAKAAPEPPKAPPKATEPPAPAELSKPPLTEVTVQVVAEPSVVAAASDGIEALLGYPTNEVVTWSAQDWFTRVHEPQLAEDLANMWSGLVGQVFEPGALPDQIMEYPLIRKDGSVVECATTWRAVQAADGKFEGLEVVIKPKP